MTTTGERLQLPGQVDADSPWPGLAPYGERDGAYFKGREAEIEELLRLVRAHRVSVLYGASGLGKTSLLRAGLSPQLLDGGELPVHLRLDFSDTAMPLREQVFTGIAACAAQHAVEVPPRSAGEALWTWLHRRANGFWGPRNQLFTPVLIFDQFEEVFTRGLASEAGARAVRRFLGRLADLAEGRPPQALMKYLERDPDGAAAYDFSQHRYRIVISLREDYLASLDELRTSMPSIMLARYRLQPMDGRQGLRVADQTRGRLVETDIAERIVRIAAGRPFRDDAFPALEDLRVDSALLGLFCRELNRRRQHQGLPGITLDLVHEGHRNILESFYEECVGREELAALRCFIEDELITANGHRDSRVVEDALLYPEIKASDINTLVDARLLRTEERNGVRRLELSHDVLTGVVRRSRDARQLRERLEAQQAQEHERLQREKEAAERKALRQQAQRAEERERLLQEKLAAERELAQQQALAVRAGQERAAEAERAVRRARREMVLVSTLSAVALALAGWAFWERQAAQEAAAEDNLEATNARKATAAAIAALETAAKYREAAQPARGQRTGQNDAQTADTQKTSLLSEAARSYDRVRQQVQRLTGMPQRSARLSTRRQRA